MWQKLSDALDGLYRLAGYMAGALLVLLCALVLYSILARMFGLYAGGASDFAGYVMATSTFMALAYTFRSDGHIRVQLVIDRFSAPKRHAVEVLCLGFMSAVTAFIAFYMVRLTVDSYEFGERSEGADAVLMWIPQTPVAVGAVLFAVSVFHAFLLALAGREPLSKSLAAGAGEGGEP